MSPQVGWCCQFCGLRANCDDKPVSGACPEREGAAHVWGNAALILADDTLRAELLGHEAKRRAAILSDVRGRAGEKFYEADVGTAELVAERAMIAGDSWTNAFIRATNAAVTEAAKRTVRGWRCDACGLAGGGNGRPEDGGCGRGCGGGHHWREWRTEEQEQELVGTWEGQVGVLISRFGGELSRAEAVAGFLRAGVPYLLAVQRAEELPGSAGPEGDASPLLRPGESAPTAEDSPSSTARTLFLAKSAPAVEAPPVEAKRGRGRPPKARAVAPEPSRIVKAPDEPSKTPKTAARLALEAERARIEAELAKIEEPAAINFYACTSSAVRMAVADGRSDARGAFVGLVAQIGRLAPLAEANGNPDSEEQAIFAGALRSLVAVGGYLGLDLEQAMSTMVDGAGGES